MAKSYEEAGPPERSFPLPYPLQYEGRHPKAHFGKLPVIKVDDLPEEARRNAHIMNRMLRKAWETLNPKEPRGRVGWECLRLRCLAFQMTQAQYLGVSKLADKSASTMKRLEEGRGRVTVYSTLLQEWPEIAEMIGDSTVTQDVARTRELVSQLIVADRPKCLARLIVRLMYKHGRDKSPLTYETVKNRVQNGLMGDAAENYGAVKAFALCEPGEEEEEEEPTEAKLWNHPYLREFRELHMADRMDYLMHKGRRRGPKEKLVEYLKLLMVPAGASISSDGLKACCPVVSQADASDIMRNHLTQISVPTAMLDFLVEREIIPPAVREQVLAVWKQALEEREESDLPVGHMLHGMLQQRGITDRIAAEIFEVTGDSRTPMTRDKIRDGCVSDVRVPPFAVACLAKDSVKDVQGDMDTLMAEHRARPYNRGKPFSRAYRTLAQYGLTPADLPEEFRKTVVVRYERDVKEVPSEQFFTAAHRAGQERAAGFVRRFVAMFQPRTVREAAQWLPVKEEQRTELARRANLSPHRVHWLADGEEVIPLPKMKKFVEAAGARWSDELEIDWHLSRAETLPKGAPLARAAHTTIGTEAEHGNDLYQKRYPREAGAPFSANLHRRAVTSVMQGEEVEDAVFERMLVGFSIEPGSEAGMYYQCLRDSKNVPSALNKWCKLMRAGGRGELVQDLLILREYVRYREERQEDLRSLLAQKKWLNEQREYEGWQEAEPPERPLQGALGVLRLLPGVRTGDLLKWSAGTGADLPEGGVPNFSELLGAEWKSDGPSAVEECRELGIDPRQPTPEEPSSPVKALILRARLELQLPSLHIAGDRKDDALKPDPDFLAAEQEPDDEETWEAKVDAEFAETMRRRQRAGGAEKKQTLKAAVDSLVSL